jgi:serine/threonine-protein kinase
MSPEQALGQPVDARADLFSLGVVFWELLTGRRLFGDDNEAATIRKLMACEVPPPHSLNPKVPKEVSALVLACLAKDPKDRFPSILHLYERLSSQLFSRPSEPGTNALVALLAELFPEDIVGYLEGLHPWAAREPGLDGEATRKLGNAGGQPLQGAPPAGPPATPSGFIPWDQVPPRVSRLPRLPRVPPSRWLVLGAGLASLVAVAAWLLILLPTPQGPRVGAQGGTFTPRDNSKPVQEMKPTGGPQRPPEEESSEEATPGQTHYPEGVLKGEGLEQRLLELLALEAKVPGEPSEQMPPRMDQDQAPAEAREVWRAARRGPRPEPQTPPHQAPATPRSTRGPRPLPGDPDPQPSPQEPQVPASAPALRPAPEMGLVFISPDPWAEIYIDGRFVAKNGDPKNYPVTVGRHKIELRHLSQTHRCTVTVEPDQRPECTHLFEHEEAANPGRLRP